jgi:hypothetical protein
MLGGSGTYFGNRRLDEKPYPRKRREPKTTLVMATKPLGRNNTSDGHNEAQATSASAIKWRVARSRHGQVLSGEIGFLPLVIGHKLGDPRLAKEIILPDTFVIRLLATQHLRTRDSMYSGHCLP